MAPATSFTIDRPFSVLAGLCVKAAPSAAAEVPRMHDMHRPAVEHAGYIIDDLSRIHGLAERIPSNQMSADGLGVWPVQDREPCNLPLEALAARHGMGNDGMHRYGIRGGIISSA